MTPEKGNAPQALAGERGAIAKQRGSASVSVPHLDGAIYPEPFDETALAFAMLALGEHGVIDDMRAASELQAMGWPVRVWNVEVREGDRPVPLWALREWVEELPRGYFDAWLQRFDDAFTEIRLQARGEDRAVLELIDWFIEDPANRTSAARRALPTSAEYSAIVARTLKEQKHARQH